MFYTQEKKKREPNIDVVIIKVCKCYNLLLNVSAHIAAWENILLLIQPVIHHYVIKISVSCVFYLFFISTSENWYLQFFKYCNKK